MPSERYQSRVHLTLDTPYRAPTTTQSVTQILGLLPVISLVGAVGLPKELGLYQAKLLLHQETAVTANPSHGLTRL